jgi:DNA-directed RNA polymerase subunit RPC12/RpoP
MKPVACPNCGSGKVFHFTDAYVVRNPVIDDDGSIELLESHTNEYDDCFYECSDCGNKPDEYELLGKERPFRSVSIIIRHLQ